MVIWVTAVGVLVGMVLYLRSRFVAVRVQGDSMEPTLHEGDRVLVRRTPLKRVSRGQLVVLAVPRDVPTVSWGPQWFIKRVVAVPGDSAPVDEVPELRAEPHASVPAGTLALLGDNAECSYDSRHAGYFVADKLLGVVIRTMRV
jgi:signal peptidase I